MVFAGVTLESAALIGLLVPAETLVLAGGIAAAHGTLDAGDLSLLVVMGAMLGDTIGSLVGRQTSRIRVLSLGRWVGLRSSHLEHVDDLLSRHGGKVIILSRFVHLMRALTPFTAGASRMRYRDFVRFDALGASIWGVCFVSLGYFLGASWMAAERWTGRATEVLVGFVALLVVVSSINTCRSAVASGCQGSARPGAVSQGSGR